MIDLFRKNKDWLIPLVGILFLLFSLIFLGIYFQKKNNDSSAHEKELIYVAESTEIVSQKGKENKKQVYPGVAASNVFFLKPDAEEIIDYISSLSPVEVDEEIGRLPGLRVMWPLYFFRVVDTKEENVQVLFDVSEDGFGVMVSTEIDVAKYPELKQMKEKDVIWIAGEIIGVVPGGTGKIVLRTEQARFGGDAEHPPTGPRYAKKQGKSPIN